MDQIDEMNFKQKLTGVLNIMMKRHGWDIKYYTDSDLTKSDYSNKTLYLSNTIDEAQDFYTAHHVCLSYENGRTNGTFLNYVGDLKVREISVN